MKHRNKIIILTTSFIAIALIVLGGIVFADIGTTTDLKGMQGEQISIVGSLTGTTTTYVDFSGNVGTGAYISTTTYPFLVGADTDIVSLFFNTSSSTLTNGSNISFNLLGSNYWNCGTATTTSYLNQPTEDQIVWYDIGNQYLARKNSTTDDVALQTATTTFSWVLLEDYQNKVITFTDLNAKCLRLDLSASSTAVYVEAMLKNTDRQ